MSTWKNYKRKRRYDGTVRKHAEYDPPLGPMDPTCPECGSPMIFRDAAGLGPMWPEGAWECTNQRCWHMMPPGDVAPDHLPEHPDQGHSDLTLPEGWQ